MTMMILHVFAQSRRRKNIWWDCNAHVASGNLEDYNFVCDQGLCTTWSDGHLMAQSRVEWVNMKSILVTSGKWLNPCPPSFSHETLCISSDQPRKSSSRVNEEMHNTRTVEESRLVKKVTIVLQSTLLHDSHKTLEYLDDSSDTRSKQHSSCIEVPGKG